MNDGMALGTVRRGSVTARIGRPATLVGMLLFACVAVGCAGPSMNLFGPSSPKATCDLKGWVWNDGSGFDEPYFKVGGATVTVLDGPNAGRSAQSSDQTGFAMSDWKSGDALFEVRKDGYDPITERKTFTCSYSVVSVLFTIGQPPHILRGGVRITRTTTIIEAARVEIMDGANAGRITQTDSRGVFQFNDLQASEPFSIRVSKTGFLTVVIKADPLAKNTTVNSTELTPE